MSKKIHPAEKFARKHSSIVFITIAALGLSTVIWLCYQTYYQATNPVNVPTAESSTPTSFDAATEAKLKKLHTRDDSDYRIEIPSDQRINPFTE